MDNSSTTNIPIPIPPGGGPSPQTAWTTATETTPRSPLGHERRSHRPSRYSLGQQHDISVIPEHNNSSNAREGSSSPDKDPRTYTSHEKAHRYHKLVMRLMDASSSAAKRKGRKASGTSEPDNNAQLQSRLETWRAHVLKDVGHMGEIANRGEDKLTRGRLWVWAKELGIILIFELLFSSIRRIFFPKLLFSGIPRVPGKWEKRFFHSVQAFHLLFAMYAVAAHERHIGELRDWKEELAAVRNKVQKRLGLSDFLLRALHRERTSELHEDVRRELRQLG